eukprot:CAMPEP_0204069330 /NCGR_PEP_ID=MMETSP0360-20130528/156736_1 /ASSEMBLY_ACC=CAM_ASM_000342 /TAXON_ID=268821 /ORGANISM="Scrippsiella Hangoei, Strain SHTV-5" /LENGTH=71 /DNA_ID=CAMNT_0051017499 /DNA_START=52 /DNA_END=267 /DNA_ORIENTATION=+
MLLLGEVELTLKLRDGFAKASDVLCSRGHGMPERRRIRRSGLLLHARRGNRGDGSIQPVEEPELRKSEVPF